MVSATSSDSGSFHGAGSIYGFCAEGQPTKRAVEYSYQVAPSIKGIAGNWVTMIFSRPVMACCSTEATGESAYCARNWSVAGSFQRSQLEAEETPMLWLDSID